MPSSGVMRLNSVLLMSACPGYSAKWSMVRTHIGMALKGMHHSGDGLIQSARVQMVNDFLHYQTIWLD